MTGCRIFKNISTDKEYIVQTYDIRYLSFLPEQLQSIITQSIFMSILISKMPNLKPRIFPRKTYLLGIDANNNTKKINDFTEFSEKINDFSYIKIYQTRYDGNLKQLIDELYQNQKKDLKVVFSQVTEIFQRANKVSFYHGDPKPENIVYKHNKGKYEFVFIDYEYSFFYAKTPTNIQEIMISNNYESIRENHIENEYSSTFKITPEGVFGTYNRDLYKSIKIYLMSRKTFPEYRGNFEFIDFPTFLGYYILYYSEKFISVPQLLSVINSYFFIYSKYYRNKTFSECEGLIKKFHKALEN